MKPLKALSSVILCGLFLAACDDGSSQEQKKQDISTLTPQNVQNSEEANKRLLEVIRTKPIEGGKLIARPNIIFFDMMEGETKEETLRLTNEGDQTIVIKNIISTTQQRGLTLDGNCKTVTEIAPGTNCDLVITYKDETKRSFDGSILVTTDSNNTPQINIPLSVDLKLIEKKPEETKPEIQQPIPMVNNKTAPAPQKENYNQALAQYISNARAQQTKSNFGTSQNYTQNTSYGTPQIVKKTQDNRYDPNIPWVESSLPVDRTRILTSDRIIKAVLDTEITNVMCNQAIAIVESHVYAPSGTNVLIPAGSKAIGRCQAFADERVNIQWERIITPNGVNISFRNQMADTAGGQGRGGVPGVIQSSFADRYIMPLLSTAIDLGSAITRAAFGKDKSTTYDVQNGRESSNSSAIDTALDEVNEKVTPQAKKIIADMTDSRKMVSIPGGSRIDIVLQEDIYFKSPYEAVKLNDVLYDLEKQVGNPKIYEQPAPEYGLTPQTGQTVSGNAIYINGKRYILSEGPQKQGPQQNQQQRSMNVPKDWQEERRNEQNQNQYPVYPQIYPTNPNGQSSQNGGYPQYQRSSNQGYQSGYGASQQQNYR